MSEKIFTFDIGRIMDEAFKAAKNFGQVFEHGMGDGFHRAGEYGDKCNWRNVTDFDPHYSYPPCNVYLTREKSLIFEIALAGFEEKDLNLQFRGDYLYFSARIPEGTQAAEGLQYFKKRLKLKNIEEQRYYAPEDKFDREKVSAIFKNGLLRIEVPPRENVAEEEEIKINIVSED